MIGTRRLGTSIWRVAASEPGVALDADLVRAAQTDPAAFGPLYERYADPVYRFCYRRLGDPTSAEDATGQVFLKALAALPGFRGGSFRSWLFAIAAHTVVDGIRERSPALGVDAAADTPDTDPDPEENSLSAERRREVRAAIAQLPDAQRRVVELRLSGLTSAEIAAATGQSLAGVKSTQTRAYARLRRLFGLAGDDDAPE